MCWSFFLRLSNMCLYLESLKNGQNPIHPMAHNLTITFKNAAIFYVMNALIQLQISFSFNFLLKIYSNLGITDCVDGEMATADTKNYYHSCEFASQFQRKCKKSHNKSNYGFGTSDCLSENRLISTNTRDIVDTEY